MPSTTKYIDYNLNIRGKFDRDIQTPGTLIWEIHISPPLLALHVLTWDQGYYMDGSLISHKDYAYIISDYEHTKRYGDKWLKFKQTHGLLGETSSLGTTSTMTGTSRGYTINLPGGTSIPFQG